MQARVALWRQRALDACAELAFVLGLSREARSAVVDTASRSAARASESANASVSPPPLTAPAPAPAHGTAKWIFSAREQLRRSFVVARAAALLFLLSLCALAVALAAARRSAETAAYARALATLSDPLLAPFDAPSRALAPIARSTIYPGAECTPVAAPQFADADAAWRHASLVRSLALYAHADGLATAAHAGAPHCVAVVRLEPTHARSEPRLLLLVNPSLVGHSEETRASTERDALCRIERVVEFRRYARISVRYADSAGRMHVRHLEDAEAARVQHALDVLGAFSVCAD